MNYEKTYRVSRGFAAALLTLAVSAGVVLGVCHPKLAYAADNVSGGIAPANLQTAEAAESIIENPPVGGEGTYLLTYKLCKTGTADASHVDGIFDAHVKLDVTNVYADGESAVGAKIDGTISLLVPAAAKARGDVVADVLRDVAIRTVDGAYVSGERTEVEGGVLFSGLPVSDLSGVQELAFGLEGSGYHSDATQADYDAYKKADLVFTGMTSWWPGFAAQAPTDLADGVYVLDIETKTGGNVDASTNTTSFTTPIMGGNVFGSKLWLSVSGGKYTAMVRAEAVSNSYVRNIRVYSRTGNYTLDSDPDSALADVKTLSYQRNEDASLFADEDAARYSDAISFNLTGKGSGYWAFLRFFITSRAPVSNMIEKTPFVILMKWDTLQPVAVPDTATLDAQLAFAKQLSEDAFEAAGWTAFKNRRDAAQDAQRASAVLSQADVDAAAAKLAEAQKALVKKAGASTETKDASAEREAQEAAVKAAQEKAAQEEAAKAAAAKAAQEKSAREQAAKKAAKEKAAKEAAAKAAAKKEAAAKAAKQEAAAKKKATPARAKLTAKTKSSKKGRVTVAWKKVAKAKGYQVKVGKKSYKVKSAKTLSKTVKAKAGAKVKVKVRAYAKYKGKVLYGPWSKAKTVKVKKR